jgi:prepilin-type processing-associated H-X9-DG protein
MMPALFLVNDPATTCAASLVSAPEDRDPAIITGYFDLLGRRLNGPPGENAVGQWYVVLFADGHTEWRMVR